MADGVVNSAEMLHSRASVPTALMYGRNVTLHLGRSNTRPLIPQVLELMVAGRLHPADVTTLTGPLEDAPAVLREHSVAEPPAGHQRPRENAGNSLRGRSWHERLVESGSTLGG